MVIAGADDDSCLLAVSEAAKLGIVAPILVGEVESIRRAGNQAGIDVSQFEMVAATGEANIAMTAVRMVHDGRADLLMKGLISTKALMQAVLNREFGLSKGGLLSHVAVFEAPTEERLILLTDAGVSVNPRFARKMEIITNAVRVAHGLGIVEPKVAVLAAIETLNLPAMPATLDAEMLRRLGEAGYFGRCIVGGPIALDGALSIERSTQKKTVDPVAGYADVLVVPNIETGNVLYKAITCIALKDMAGIVVGATLPVVVSSRADTKRTKVCSIALASVLRKRERA